MNLYFNTIESNTARETTQNTAAAHQENQGLWETAKEKLTHAKEAIEDTLGFGSGAPTNAEHSNFFHGRKNFDAALDPPPSQQHTFHTEDNTQLKDSSRINPRSAGVYMGTDIGARDPDKLSDKIQDARDSVRDAEKDSANKGMDSKYTITGSNLHDTHHKGFGEKLQGARDTVRDAAHDVKEKLSAHHRQSGNASNVANDTSATHGQSASDYHHTTLSDSIKHARDTVRDAARDLEHSLSGYDNHGGDLTSNTAQETSATSDTPVTHQTEQGAAIKFDRDSSSGLNSGSSGYTGSYTRRKVRDTAASYDDTTSQ